jgi:cell division transport system ATP-binding protein
VIQLDDVSKRYPGGHEALAGLKLVVEAGELVFVTGHSGAGKSTLLKLITLIERPTRGLVLVGGVNTARLPARRIPAFRRRIGVVFQDNKLLHDRSVYDNVALPLVIDGASTREIGRKVRAALDQVGLLGKERRRPIELSQGEQQRIGIARAVVSRPPLLVADEPTGNLDPELSEEIMALFLRFTEVGVTVLIASHDRHLIESLGRRTIRLQDGRLVADGAPGHG